MSFDMSRYYYDDDQVWYHAPGDNDGVSVGEIHDGWNVEDLFRVVHEHARSQWSHTLSTDELEERTLSVDSLFDACSVGAGAAMSPAGPVGVVVFEFATSAKPDEDPLLVNLALMPDALRDLRQVIVNAFREAIQKADRAKRRPS